MNTGPGGHAAFIQGNQSTVEQDSSKSALFHLFQEVSKLAPPLHNSFHDSKSLPTWLNDTSRQDPFTVKRNEDHPNLFQTSNGNCQHNLSPYNQIKKMKEKSHSTSVAPLVEPHPECSTAWKVLSLINLQCERLMHQQHEVELDARLVSSSRINSSCSSTKPTAAGVGVTDCTLKQKMNPMLDVSADHSGQDRTHKPQGFVKDSVVFCSVPRQTAEATDTVSSQPLEENASASSQREKMEIKFSVNTKVENWDCRKNCVSSQQDIVNLPFAENALSVTDITKASLNIQLTLNANEDADVALSKPASRLDHNANLALTTGPHGDPLLPPSSSDPSSSRSAALSCSTAESCQSLSKQDDKSSKLESAHAPIEDKSPPVAQLKSASCHGETNCSPSAKIRSKPKPIQKEKSTPPFTHQCSSKSIWRTRAPRKQPNPCRSGDIQDPRFHGVAFRMDTELDNSREQCRLLITSKYSKELHKSVRKARQRTRMSQKSFTTNSSDEETNPTNTISRGKVCASCCTRKTPMWRDAEDGTPLCNACGIRYKKYRVRCVNCWHIPRKEGNANSCCLKCGHFVKLTSALPKHTT